MILALLFIAVGSLIIFMAGVVAGIFIESHLREMSVTEEEEYERD